jgi:hypothetical protein
MIYLKSEENMIKTRYFYESFAEALAQIQGHIM